MGSLTSIAGPAHRLLQAQGPSKGPPLRLASLARGLPQLNSRSLPLAKAKLRTAVVIWGTYFIVFIYRYAQATALLYSRQTAVYIFCPFNCSHLTEPVVPT